MKKLFTGICFILCGCGQQNPAAGYWTSPVRNEPPKRESAQAEPAKEVPEKKDSSRLIKNEKCENLPAVRIFKVTNDFSLARACRDGEKSGETFCSGHIVYLPREEGRLHYDGQNIKPNSGKCFSYNGTYRYTDGEGETHFVPKAEVVDSMVEEPDWNSYLLERTRR